MGFCTNCGKQLDGFSKFCSFCGAPVGQPEVKQEIVSSAVVFKYEKSALFMMLTEPLAVSLDGQLNFKVVDGRDVCYNVGHGNHTLTAYVPYLAGSKYGQVTKNFYVGANEVFEILYKPPMAVFMTGIITIRKIR